MTTLAATATERASRGIAAQVLRLALLLAGTLAMRSIFGLAPETSWMITLAERVLSGEALYVDLLDPAPPLLVWIHVGLVASARLAASQPETIVDAALIGAALLSADLCVRLDPQSRRGALVFSCVAGALLLLPARSFGARDHLGAIFILPVVFALARRLSGRAAGEALSLLVGLCAGVALCVSPPLSLALAPAALLVLWRERSLALCFSLDALTALALASAGLIATYLLHPAWFETMRPLLDIVDGGRGLSWRELAPMTFVWCGAAGLTLALARDRDDVIGVLILASAGLLAATLLHGADAGSFLPALASICVAATLAVGSRGWRARSAAICLAAAAVAGFSAGPRAPRLEAALGDAPRLRLLALSGDASLAHPLTRNLGGAQSWRVGSLWIASGVERRAAKGGVTAAEQRAMEAAIALERAMLREALVVGQPDVILRRVTETDWLAFARQDAETARALEAYASRGVVEGIEILRRRAPVAQASPS